MFILGNLPAEQAQDFLSRSWVPQNFHMYYSAKEISRQKTSRQTLRNVLPQSLVRGIEII